jgi:hypothetical protein
MKAPKYVLDWQVKRIEAQRETDIKNKLAVGCAHFYCGNTVEARERVLNWLDGLALGYQHNEEALAEIAARRQEIAVTRPFIRDIQLTHARQKPYGEEILRELALDLLKQEYNLAKKGVLKEGLNNFILELAQLMKNEKLTALVLKHAQTARDNYTAGKEGNHGQEDSKKEDGENGRPEAVAQLEEGAEARGSFDKAPLPQTSQGKESEAVEAKIEEA